MPGPGLLAQILMDKFVDHLPVYRQVQRYERLGIRLSESTLGGWLSSTCELLNPLYEALRQCVLGRTYLQGDETDFYGLSKRWCIVFFIFCSSFYHSKNAFDKFISNGIDHCHFILAF